MRYVHRNFAGLTAMNRHGGGGGMGNHRGRGGFGHRGSGFRSGRMLAAADLQLIVLALLEDKERHGYEIIKAVQEKTNGCYSPSPGMVYPALTYLEEIGYALGESDGVKKLYRLTDAGRAHVAEQRSHVDAVLARLIHVGQRMRRARLAFDEEERPAGSTALDAARALDEARRDFKEALFDALDAEPEEQMRITAILKRATAEIGKK
jgi:DNA-binding PadR family transcriptional regulator